MDDDARAWVARALLENGLGEAGAFAPVKIRAWASVFRVSTAAGDIYFKANAPGGRHEPALASQLSAAWPSLVPAPLAIEPDRGWMLTPDHGQRMSDELDEEAQLSLLEQLLPRYAELQIASAREPERWLALGVPDRRLEHVPTLAERLLRENVDLEDAERSRMLALIPELAARCDELGMVGPALDHGDLHGANILVGRNGTWIFDWADANVSHPFGSLLVTCNVLAGELESAEGRRRSARLVDAYLEPFSAHAAAPALRALIPVALWVAHVGRALDWDHMLAGTDSPDRKEWLPRIAQWLRLWEERSHWARHRTWP